MLESEHNGRTVNINTCHTLMVTVFHWSISFFPFDVLFFFSRRSSLLWDNRHISFIFLFLTSCYYVKGFYFSWPTFVILIHIVVVPLPGIFFLFSCVFGFSLAYQLIPQLNRIWLGSYCVSKIKSLNGLLSRSIFILQCEFHQLRSIEVLKNW